MKDNKIVPLSRNHQNLRTSDFWLSVAKSALLQIIVVLADLIFIPILTMKFLWAQIKQQKEKKNLNPKILS